MSRKLAAVLMTVGMLAIGGCGDEQTVKADAKPTPTKTATATPDPATGPFNFGISAAEYDDDPERLAEEYYRQLNLFFIAGADKERASDDRRYEVIDRVYVDEWSPEIDDEFVSNLFVSNWQDIPELADYVNKTVKIAHSVRWSRIATYGGAEAGQYEPYLRETVLDGVTGSVDAETVTTSARWHERDNRDKNTVESLVKGVDPNTQTGGDTLTWVNVDGQLKIGGMTRFTG